MARNQRSLAWALIALSIPGLARADGSAHAIHVPEPMVFDLVHSLGVEKGAFEANALVLFPTNDSGDRPIDWAPEVEYAVADGIALEFELDYEDSDLEAYKFAAQFMFGEALDGRMIHGSQFIVERFDDDDIWEWTGLYLAGMAFENDWSALAMLGLRTDSGDDAHGHDEILANISVFKQLSHRWVFGLESDFAIDIDDDTSVLLAPQFHYEINDVLEIQLTVGAEYDNSDWDGFAGFRFIYAN